MGDLDPEVMEFFLEEANDYILSFETLLLKGEKDGWEETEASEVKRILHNLKGTSYSLGLTEFGDAVHAMEELMDKEENTQHLAMTFLGMLCRIKTFLASEAKETCAFYNFNHDLESNFNKAKAGTLKFNMPGAISETSSSAEEIGTTQKKGSDFLKCRVQKIDDLINLFSEQVTLQSSLSYLKRDYNINENKICSTISQLEKVTFDLQKAVFALRMIDLNRTFSMLHRSIRDTAQALKLEVDVDLIGAENELDKTIVDSLIDPLNHLVKNCVDHGLASVKDERPLKVTIKAFQRSGYFNLCISDNGMGICKESVYQKALVMGIAKPNVDYSDQEIYNFIFKSGFSTKESANEISGRGVGMNVVEEMIHSFKGSIDIHSVQGQGSEFKIQIPLSLAMFNGLVFDVNEKNYVVANSDIREIIDLKKVTTLNINENDQMVKIRDEVIPVVDAHQIFGGDKRQDGVLLVVTSDDKKFAIKVDRVSNQQRVVSRELGEDLSNLDSVSGATILSDGTLAPIVNITRFLNIAKVS